MANPIASANLASAARGWSPPDTSRPWRSHGKITAARVDSPVNEDGFTPLRSTAPKGTFGLPPFVRSATRMNPGLRDREISRPRSRRSFPVRVRL